MAWSTALVSLPDDSKLGREQTIYRDEHSVSRNMKVAAALLALPVAACDVAWGGASISLENPAPVPEALVEQVDGAESAIQPLPTGDLLYLVRFMDSEGAVRLVPAARLVGGIPTDPGLPQTIDDSYRARFDSVFFAADLELTLHAGGHRIGSVIVDGTTVLPNPACLSFGHGRALLLPGTPGPEYGFAWAGAGRSGEATPYVESTTDTRMAIFGPVLAENLLRQGGETRPYLAVRSELLAVPWEGDDRPAMVATYLVNDNLASEPPANAASSLFVLARFDRARGYVPEWSEVRRYGNGRAREAFTYLGAMEGSAGRVDFVTRHDGNGVSLAASVTDDGERGIDWMENEGACSAITLVGTDATP